MSIPDEMYEMVPENDEILGVQWYHDPAVCRARGGAKHREFGWPVKCVQQWSTGESEYQCPACGRVWQLPAECGND